MGPSMSIDGVMVTGVVGEIYDFELQWGRR